ncbi:DUF6445 family protein [Sphingomonas sp. MMS12-HWE2-04]|uniref:DUF6445 family protein n=1 Tax=Sphingomonas sp. MMS12-HWE2-04 TaxID=3234199 RepID=UPI00384DE34F
MASFSASDFSLNGNADMQLRQLGFEREPMLQVDGLLRSAEPLIAYAAGANGFAPADGPEGGYPGLRAPAPLAYVEAVVRAVDPLLRHAFRLGPVKLGRAECNFSLVTRPPGELVPAQRAPHIDTTDPLQFAFLHYLCGPEFGGTGFYRHRATGFETITPERITAYEAARATEAPGEGYIRGDTADFERTALIEAAMNRLIVYRSHLLHSGSISPDAPLCADPRAGRLTANIFVTYRPV